MIENRLDIKSDTSPDGGHGLAVELSVVLLVQSGSIVNLAPHPLAETNRNMIPEEV